MVWTLEVVVSTVMGDLPAQKQMVPGSMHPDGNTWAVQQIKARAENPLIPLEARARFGEGQEA